MNDALSPIEKVAKMLVDHLINPKGCTHHTPVDGEMITGMHEFIYDRRELLEKIQQFMDPDFAHSDRLPVKARLPGDPGHEVKDEFKKLSGNQLGHMNPDEWNECHKTVGQIFTGGNERDRKSVV